MEARQRSLFEPRDQTIRPQDIARLKGQNRTVLEMLRLGPRTNRDFVAVGIFRYSARIYDLRQEGFKIETEQGNRGRTTFTLIGKGNHD